MQPNTPPAPPPAPLPNGNQNPYDFIMNSGPSKKGYGAGSSMMQRIIIVVVGGMVLLIGVIVVFALLTKNGGGSTAQFTDLAEQQTEIARVADLGLQKATSTVTINLAHTTKLSMISSQRQTVALISKEGHKISDKQLALKQNSTTDQQLNDAAANNNFEATFTKLLTDELNSYRQSLLNAYKSSSSSDEKALLQGYFDGVGLLVGTTTNS